jgi:hypothetical protein
VVFELRYNTRLSYDGHSVVEETDEAIRLLRRNNIAGQYQVVRTAVGWKIAVTQASANQYDAVPGSPVAFRIVRKADSTYDTFTDDVAVLGVMFVRDELPDPPPALYSTDCGHSWWSLPRTAVMDGKHVAGGSSQTGEVVLNIYEKTATTSERRVIAQSDYSDDHQ